MSTWKCIHCGTTIMSKCPGQRSEFYSHEVQLLKSVLTIDNVVNAKKDFNELFISYTGCTSTPIVKQIKNLVKTLSKKGTVEALMCDHSWVMNSTTERTCCLDHEHSNLTDVPKLRREYKKRKDAQVRTVQDEVYDFASVALTPIDLARRALNLSKPKFDPFVEAEFGVLKHKVRESMERLSEGKSWRPIYRVMTGGTRWTDAVYAYFDREEDAIALARGANKMLDIEKLDTESDSGYRSIQYELTTTCVYCGKLNMPEGNIIVKLPEGEAHLTCINRKKLDDKVKTRYARFHVRSSIRLEYRESVAWMDRLGLDGFDGCIQEDKPGQMVFVKGTMNKMEFENAIRVLKSEVFI